MNPGKLLLSLVSACALLSQTVQMVKVERGSLDRSIKLNGEILPFQWADLHARVPGFVERVLVDRGSVVRQGELLVIISAPELEAQVSEAEAKARAAEAAAAEAKAKAIAAQSTYNGLKEAAATPGAIAGNELVVARQTAAAAWDVANSAEASVLAAKASLTAVRKTQEYLNITAPFAGVVTERLVHPGALAGPNTGPLVRLEQISRLRLVVAVPEANTSGTRIGARVPFRVAAFPTRTFDAPVARIARSVDPKTRTMSVELDVANASVLLAPGMYPEVNWPVRSDGRMMLVPSTSVVRTSERVFVIRAKNGRAEWVDVGPGASQAGRTEVFGDLSAGDLIVRNGSDEIRQGTALNVAAPPGTRPRAR